MHAGYKLRARKGEGERERLRCGRSQLPHTAKRSDVLRAIAPYDTTVLCMGNLLDLATWNELEERDAADGAC